MPERGSIQIAVIGTTDVGQVREHNEDNLLVADLTTGDVAETGTTLTREIGEKGFLVTVADGMGGAASGELASEMAVGIVLESLSADGGKEGEADTAQMGEALSAALTTANTQIHDKSQAEAEHRGMGTTMTAAYLMGSDLSIAQVGDSRGYLLRKGKLVQVTKDQSLISQLIDDGTLTEEEAEKLGGRNIILQALGVEGEVTVDVKSMEVLDGDVLLLCSDGLTGMVKDEEIETTILGEEDLGVACARLVEMANAAGGRDNITVILVRMSGDGLRPPMKPLEEEAGGEKRDSARPATFAPPPPPEETKEGPSRMALFGAAGGLVLALVLVLLLTGGAAEVTFVFPAPGATATLVPEEGEAITVVVPAGASRVVVPDVPPGKYTLEATLARHEDLTMTVEIARGDPTVTVNLHPLPGTLLLVSGTPRVSVRIQEFEPPEGETAWQQTLQVGTAAETRVEGVPAGPIVVVQSRTGFTARSRQETMPPGGGESGVYRVELDELAEDLVPAILNFDPSLSGARVQVTDDYGEMVWEGSVPAEGTLTTTMRLGSHSMEVSHESFETETFSITLKAGENVPFDRLKLRPKSGSLSLTGPVGAVVFVNRGGNNVATEQVGDDGRLEVSRLAPGRYEVEMNLPGGGKRTGTVEVRAAEVSEVEWQE